MRIEFLKMHGGGNDFVLMDNMDGSLAFFGAADAAAVCDRRRGIGADGVVLMEPATSRTTACSWRFFNSDGSIAEMCGNGARCFAAFARRCGVVSGSEPFSFDTVAGIVSAEFIGSDQISVGLTKPHGYRCFPLGLGGVSELGALHYIDTGVPHVAAFVPDVTAVDVMGIGPVIRRYIGVFASLQFLEKSSCFRCEELRPHGTNVNFVQVPSFRSASHPPRA
jgi:diaminopimelate epimerase